MLKLKNLLYEDLDLGHTDNEPKMLKSDLEYIKQYATELIDLIDKLDPSIEIDFPHWWQSRIIQSKELLNGANDYIKSAMSLNTQDASYVRSVSKARAKSTLRQIEKGSRDDGFGEVDAKVYAVKDNRRIELKTLKDLDKYSVGYEYVLI
jgi:hypothetical protein